MKKIIFFVGLLLVFSSIAAGSTIFGIRTNSPNEIMNEISAKPYLVYFTAGKIYFKLGEMDKAREMFERTIELNPNFAPGFHNLGVVNYYSGDILGALEALNKAVAIEKGYSEAYYSLGILYFEAGNFEGAAANFLHVSELEPYNANAHYDLAQSIVAKFREEEINGNIEIEKLNVALQHMRKAEEISPGFEHALENIKIIESVIDSY